MQSGRKFSLDDRGIQTGVSRAATGAAGKALRNAESDKRKPPPLRGGDAGKVAREAKVASVVNLPAGNKAQPKAIRKPAAPIVAAHKPRTRVSPPPKNEENRVSYSIQKLLSVYENPEDAARSKPAEDKRAKVYGKPRAAEVRKSSPMNVQSRRSSAHGDKTTVELKESSSRGKAQRASEESQRKPVPKKRVSTEPAKTAEPRPAAPDETVESPPEPSAPEEECEELVPILTPERSAETPVNLLNFFISSYLEDETEDGQNARNQLDFLLTKYDDSKGNLFPVCSKRAMDNIPSTEAAEGIASNKSDIIIMLRRRNSEPNSHRSLLQYPEETAPPFSLGCETLQNYYLWEPGPKKHCKPFWEVSLFKTNRSLSVLPSQDGSGSLTPPSPSYDLTGHFSDRTQTQEADNALKPWLPDISYCSSSQGVAQTLTFVTLMQRGKTPSPGISLVEAAAPEDPAPPSPPPRKESQEPQPATQLALARSSSRVVATESHAAVKKLQRITKVRRIASELRPGVWHKHVLFTVASAVALVAGGFILFLLFLVKPQSFFSLTPPIPGLVRDY